MASLSAIRAAVADTISARTTLQTYDTVPDVAVVPAVVIFPVEADYAQAMGRGFDRYEFDLFVLTSRAVSDAGQNALDDYVTGAGTSSIREAIWGHKTLGLEHTDAHISGMSRYGGEFQNAQVPHVGAVLRLVVHTPGTS